LTHSPPKPDIEPVATLVEELRHASNPLGGVPLYPRQLMERIASALLALEGERDATLALLSLSHKAKSLQRMEFRALKAEAEVAQMREALEQIEEGMSHVRAPHRLSAARALAKNTLALKGVP
jgi:Xaa-Pro aminopeptidase